MLKIYQNISKISKKFDKNFKNISKISKKFQKKFQKIYRKNVKKIFQKSDAGDFR